MIERLPQGNLEENNNKAEHGGATNRNQKLFSLAKT